MAKEVQLQRERKAALRGVRREQRTVDSTMEKWERELARLLKRKTLIDVEDAQRLTSLYNDFFTAVQRWESAMSSFVKIFT